MHGVLICFGMVSSLAILVWHFGADIATTIEAMLCTTVDSPFQEFKYSW